MRVNYVADTAAIIKKRAFPPKNENKDVSYIEEHGGNKNLKKTL